MKKTSTTSTSLLSVHVCLTAAVMGMWPTAAVARPFPKWYKRFVDKTVFDDNFRFVFIAGLEGTGHHGMKDLLGVTGLSYNRAGLGAEATQAIFHHTLPDYRPMRDDQRNNAEILREHEQLKTHLRNLMGNATAKGNNANIFLLNPATYGGWTMLSYPNMAGNTKSLQHPDMVTLAKLCEEVGVDLRILVLSRDPRDTVASSVRRGFGHAILQSEALADNAAVLATQLQLIDSRFFMCVHTEMLGDVSSWSRFRTTPHNNDNDVVLKGSAAKRTTNAEWLHPLIGPAEVSKMVGKWHYDPSKSRIVKQEKDYRNHFEYEHAKAAAAITREDAHVRTLADSTALLERVADCPLYEGAFRYT